MKAKGNGKNHHVMNFYFWKGVKRKGRKRELAISQILYIVNEIYEKFQEFKKINFI